MSFRIAKSNPAMKLIVLFTASFTWAFQQQAELPKYQYRNPVTADLLLCDQCPPGTAVKQHCTLDTPTECQPCPERHYAESWHWGDTCQYCTSVCKERQLVKQQCNSTHDQLCECAPGFHLVVEFCIKHTVCAPGYGVTALGTAETDTVCERCPTGHFSSGGSSTEPCVPHRSCTDLGLRTLRQGTSNMDSLCGQQEKSSTVLECSKHHAQCHTDVTLCEEALFHSLTSLQLSSVPLERFLETRPRQRVDHKGLERLKKACPPQLLRLWMEQKKDLEQKKDQDKLYGIIRGINHCERKVSHCAGLKNVTLDDLLMVTDSLPGVKVRPEDVQAVVSSCLPRQYVVQLLHLWKTVNYDMDLAKGLTQSLRVLRSQGAPRSLLKTMKKIRMFVNMLHDESCFKTHKPLNE